jgi:hypothetical protein
LNAISDFVYSTATPHTLTGSTQVSPYLSLAVSAYSQLNGGTIKLVVFHDTDAAYSIFPFVKGVLFVEDTEVSVANATLQTATEDQIHLANNTTMTLIGVITVDATHPLA